MPTRSKIVQCWAALVTTSWSLQNFITAAVYDPAIQDILEKCLTNGKGFPFKLIGHEESVIDPSIKAFEEIFLATAQGINMGYSRIVKLNFYLPMGSICVRIPDIMPYHTRRHKLSR